MTSFAKLISFIFHPVILIMAMPYLVVYRQTGSEIYALKWQIFSSLFIFLGVLLFFFGRWKGVFSDTDVFKRNERTRFYFIAWFLAFLYFAAALFFKGVFFPLSIIALGIIFGILVLEVVNHFIKASLHVGIASAFVTATGLLFGNTAFLATVLIVPLLAWARWVLKKHTISEVVLGAFLGTAVTFLTFFIGKYALTGKI